MDVVLLFPGQGSQKPGMGRDLAEAFPSARSVYDAVDSAIGVSVSSLSFDGPADELTLTHNAQPALLAHGAAVWAVVRDRLAGSVRATAGHSLGEFTAYHAADALDVAVAARVVRRRGELMLESGRARPGTMAAIIGEPSPSIEEICAQATSGSELVVPANYNAPGQVVISGDAAAVERASALARAAGAKLAVPLNVSGAFHSPLMAPAAAGLAEALAGVPFADPRVPVYANVDARPVRDRSRAAALLTAQLTAPVRWADVVRHLVADFPHAVFVEMGPGAVLTGLVKKIARTAITRTCGTVADVDRLLDSLA